MLVPQPFERGLVLHQAWRLVAHLNAAGLIDQPAQEGIDPESYEQNIARLDRDALTRCHVIEDCRRDLKARIGLNGITDRRHVFAHVKQDAPADDARFRDLVDTKDRPRAQGVASTNKIVVKAIRISDMP